MNASSTTYNAEATISALIVKATIAAWKRPVHNIMRGNVLQGMYWAPAFSLEYRGGGGGGGVFHKDPKSNLTGLNNYGQPLVALK